MTTTTYTRFSATIHLPGHVFPLPGRIDDDANMLMLANRGTTPVVPVHPAIQSRADDIRRRLLAGETVTTTTATIVPQP